MLRALTVPGATICSRGPRARGLSRHPQHFHASRPSHWTLRHATPFRVASRATPSDYSTPTPEDPAPSPAHAAIPADVSANIATPFPAAPGSATTPSSPSADSSPSTGSHRRRQHQHQQAERLKVALLAALSSLDRGLAANAREAAEVDELCSRLEELGGPVSLALLPSGASTTHGSPVAGDGSTLGSLATDGDLLAGTWRLVYSSAFNSGSLGGRRPGPPAALFPTVLGQVYQRIDPATAKLDNIVELLFSYGPLDLGVGSELLGGLTRGAQALGLGRGLKELLERGGVRPEQLPASVREALEAVEGEGGPGPKHWRGGERGTRVEGRRRESPAARLTLRHDYEVAAPANVRIVYEETYGELVGSDLFSQLPRLAAPSLPEPLKPPRSFRSATFEVTYLDPSLRITRGDRGELRVYLRDEEAGREAALGLGAGAAAAAMDYDD